MRRQFASSRAQKCKIGSAWLQVMPRYQQVDIREPNSTLHWTLPENDRTGQQACLSQFFKKGSSSFTVYCSFLPHTPDRPNSESNAAETLLAFQGVQPWLCMHFHVGRLLPWLDRSEKWSFADTGAAACIATS